MLQEPRQPQQTPEKPTPANEKQRRFRIVKLEERIAPGNGNGNGSNYTCGNPCNGGGGSHHAWSK